MQPIQLHGPYHRANRFFLRMTGDRVVGLALAWAIAFIVVGFINHWF